MKPEPSILVIFGATGDLTRRKLYPALFNLWREGLLPRNFAIVCVGRRDISPSELYRDASDAVHNFSRRRGHSQQELDAFLQRLSYYQLEFHDQQGYGGLKDYLDQVDGIWHTRGNRVFFLAVAPIFFSIISRQLKDHGMTKNHDSWQRLVVEKPFGQDLASAISLNRDVRSIFPEENIYRIDHYLGKEMTQNIMVIRFANTFFEPLWNNRYVDHVQISFAETIGVETRGTYYEQAGALRDMMQNHALQILSLIAMEPPVALDTESVRDEKVKVLRSLKILEDDVVRGQYEGYRQEDHVAPDSQTETFVALKATIDNFRWAGVPFYLRTGKRLPQKYVEIVISFKRLPGVLYFENEDLGPNVLVIRLQPEEGVYLQFNAKRPGTASMIQPVSMDFCQNCHNGLNSPEAYERLLYDVMRGDSTLFTRWDEVEHSWRFVEKIARWWEEGDHPLPVYAPNTWGPPASHALLQADGRSWLRFMTGEV
jgi:glucose-6-phosphate 1-dehydrogenase